MRNKISKKIFTGVLMLTVAIAGFAVPDSVQAAETSPVKYQKVKYSDMKDCIGETAPECTLESDTNVGYLFAGWYETEDNTNPIRTAEDVTDATDDTIVYAKFIPSYLAGIACQVDKNQNAEDDRNLRVVSLVDSKNYSSVGFNVYGRFNKDQSEDGSNETEWLMYQYSSDTSNPNAAESTKIYTGLYEYDADDNKTLRTPEYVFGSAAEGFYFTTVCIAGIGSRTSSDSVTYDFRDATMAVKPYWITLDGTCVEGLGEFNRVNDDEDKIVNVSVNLKDAAEIAAGGLNITAPSGFDCTKVEVETGRVFAEMNFDIVESTIKCIGNVSGGKNAANPNEVYVNLRFTVDDSSALTKGANEFTVNVPENAFCDEGEQFADVAAWNVKY